MSTHKLRASLVAFCIGFLLGLAVLAAVRLLVQSQSFGHAASVADWATLALAALAVVAGAFAAGRLWTLPQDRRRAVSGDDSPVPASVLPQQPAAPSGHPDPARAALASDLRIACERGEFLVFYQPQVELASGKLRGYEALVRWERRGEGILSPSDFLDVAEESGLIVPIGDFVLNKACRDAASWLDGGTVAVNLSAAQFSQPDLAGRIAAVLAETGLPASRLEIEVPESLFLKPGHNTLETLHRIKALGVRVAMDDFGASYSSLSSIAHFPFDKIKIDKSFVGQLAADADVAAIVASIVGLGRALSVDVTAEGVETREQVTLLRAAGCSIVQGFLFGMPKRDAGRPHDSRSLPESVAPAAAAGNR